MTFTLTKRGVLLGAGGLLVVAAAVLLLARQALAALVVNALLHMAGAHQISFAITKATPWRVVVEDISFQVGKQAFAAKRVSVTRDHWWSASLGVLRVEQAMVPVVIERRAGPTPETAGKKPAAGPVIPDLNLPFREFALDGQLVVKANGLPDQSLKVKIHAHATPQDLWAIRLQAEGPGLGLEGEGRANFPKNELTFRLPSVTVDVVPWQDFVRRLVPVAGDWEIAGKFTAQAEGRLAGNQVTATGALQLREGRVKGTKPEITAEGIEADLEFTDISEFTTKPGTLRVREMQAGQLALREMAYEFALKGTDRIAITKATFKALGGSVAAEPFEYVVSKGDLEAVVLVDGIDVEQVMALTPDLPAKATGRVNGRIPLRIDESGLQFGTGWLQLKPGVPAEVQFNAAGMLTNGVAASNPSYAVLKKVESGLLKLRISALRLDIRPPNAPEGRSAQLHIAGEPVDPEVKAPVILDLNVNGPLEKLINLGLDSRISFGSKP
jgi:hypothetical protein